jgi:hypothetical protein
VKFLVKEIHPKEESLKFFFRATVMAGETTDWCPTMALFRDSVRTGTAPWWQRNSADPGENRSTRSPWVKHATYVYPYIP